MTRQAEAANLSPLLRFSREAWSRLRAAAPLTHLAYDILPGEEGYVRQPEVLIVEGLNVWVSKG